MRRPRVRFTVGRLMIAVAVVGMILGLAELGRRRSSCLAKASEFGELERYHVRDAGYIEAMLLAGPSEIEAHARYYNDGTEKCVRDLTYFLAHSRKRAGEYGEVRCHYE